MLVGGEGHARGLEAGDDPRASRAGDMRIGSPVSLAPAPADGPARPVTRGKKRPRGVAWFAFRSLWGPMSHLVASLIATKDIDSRDWMHAEHPPRFARRVAKVLLGSEPHGPDGSESLTELLDREIWIDFVADTGDDVSVSEAVGRLVATSYALPDPDHRGNADTVTAHRGDILLHGGDVAYPVATDADIHDRFVVPFNRALLADGDDRPRVLMGVPGNHDWYNGLDGFGRLMRRHARPPSGDSAGQGRGQPHRTLRFGKELLRVGQLQKRRTLVLAGYVPVQDASYFALPLAPRLDLWGLDRQLGSIDYRQRRLVPLAGNWQPGRPGNKR